MTTILSALGGRKATVILIALVLMALKNVIGIDDETIGKIVMLALGGAGVIAAEDAVKAIVSPKKPTEKK